MEVKENDQVKISNRFVTLNWVTMMCTPTGLGKSLERVENLQPQRVCVVMI